MTNKTTLLAKLIWFIKKQVIHYMPRWLADCGFRHVCDTCMMTSDWNDLTVADLDERWYLRWDKAAAIAELKSEKTKASKK